MGQTHIHFLKRIQVLNQLFFRFRSRFLDEFMVVAKVILDDAVPTDETAASEAVDLHWLVVCRTHLKGRLLNNNLSSPSLFKFVKGDCLVSSKYSQFPVYCHTLCTDELDTLSTECFGLASRTSLTLGLYLTVSSLHFGVHLFHSVDKESCWEVVHAPLREGGVLTTLRAGEWLVNAFPQGQSVDALFAVVVAAREDLGLCVMLMTDGTRDLLLYPLCYVVALLGGHS